MRVPVWAATLATLTASCGDWGCGASPLEVQVATYAAAEQACVAQATSYDAGLTCLHSVKQAFCGPGGVWSDSGVCPDGGPL